MGPEDINNFLRAQPFQPFRITMSSEETFEIRHPDSALLTRRTIAVGVRPSEHPRLFGGVVHLSLLHIVRLEPIEAEATA